MGSRRKIVNTDETREKFLNALAEGMTVLDASKHIGVNAKTVYRWRESDKKFADAWADAYLIGNDALEAEAQRRAVDGVEEAVYYQGVQVGTVRKYSDTLLIFLLKARNPSRYCERVRAARIEAESEAKRLAAEASNNSQASAAVINFLNDLAAQKAAMAKGRAA